jgi:hypothetical protein
MKRPVRKPDPTLETDDFKMILEHTHQLTQGSAEEVAELPDRLCDIL